MILYRTHILGRTGLFTVRIDAEGTIADVEPFRGIVPSHALSAWKSHAQEPEHWDLEKGLLLPGMVDAHTHLDKALTLPFTTNTSGTLEEAISRFKEYQPKLTEEDVLTRAVMVAQQASRYGTTTLRTHLNSAYPDPNALKVVLNGMQEAQRILRRQMDLQLVLMCPTIEDDQWASAVLPAMAPYLAAIGGAPALARDPNRNLTWILDWAERLNLAVDLHIDETLDPLSQTLNTLAEQVPARGMQGLAIAGHCVSLGAMSLLEASAIADKVAQANIGVITLPQTNLYLQGREDETSPRRGLTRISLLNEAGVQVASASDNIQDAFHPFGNGDLLLVALITAYGSHFGESSADTLLKMVSEIPGKMIVNTNYGIHAGQPADLVALECPTALSGLQTLLAGRRVWKRGRLVNTTLLAETPFGTTYSQ